MGNYLKACRGHFFHIGVFSFFGNLLLLAQPLYMLQVYDRVLTSRSQETLVMLMLITLGLLVAMMVLDILRSRLLLATGIGLDRALGPEVVKGMLDEARQPGAVPSALGLGDINRLRNFLTGQGILAFFDAPWALVFTALIFLFHPLLGIVAVAGALMLLVLAWLNERLTRGPLAELGKRDRRATRFIETGMRNAEAVGALGMLSAVTERWTILSHEVSTAGVSVGRRAGTLVAATKLIRLSIQVVMLGVGAYVVIHQEATAGVMIAATVMLGRALAPVEQAVTTWKGFVEARSAYQRLDALLKNVAPQPNRVELPPPQGRLTVERVVMASRGSSRPILKGISLELMPGESLAIVGSSAAGKSTLARILTGVWKPHSGAVRLDGADIAEWEPDRLGRYIGYLPQDIELFAGTVGENIARLSSAPSEAIVTAAQRAHVHEMILRLPSGYETEIGEGGVLLSTGQRQRIGLARALFGEPRLIVLDEPNANLDAEGEEALLKAMKGLKASRVTQIIISHKPALLAHVDKMLVLRDGQVALFGPTREVLSRISRSNSQVVTPIHPVTAEKEAQHG